jgi:Zn-dependent protease
MAQARVRKDQAQPVVVEWQKRVDHSYVSAKPTQSRFHFSKKELGHLVLASVLVVGIGLSLNFASVANGGLLQLALSIAAFTISFLAHEIAHKMVAQKHGLWAEFRLTFMGAILTALSIALPLKFISPGAVMVAGAADRRTIGRTAVAGPATNILLASVFSVAAVVLSSYGPGFGVIAWFNAWIAAVNLIPFGIFDGMKVFIWSKRVWALAFAVSGALTAGLAMAFFNGVW